MMRGLFTHPFTLFRVPAHVIREASCRPALRAARVLGLALVAALLGSLAACTVGKDHQVPAPLPAAAPVPEQYKEALSLMKPARPADTLPKGAWWQVFADARLDAMMHEVAQNNQNLQLAAAKYRQARAALQQVSAARLPAINGSAGATRGNSSLISNPTSNFSLGASASWEVDVWGRVSRSIEAGGATAQAAQADLMATALSLQAQLASTYAALGVVDAQAALLARAVTSYERSLKLTQNRYAAGVASRIDVVQAETQWLSTKAQYTDTGIQRAQLEHALAVLLGKAPSAFSLAPGSTRLLPLPQVAQGLPSQMLERRPDVAAAERRVAAANAQIGVTEAAFFPSLVLNASAGLRSPVLSDLFAAPIRTWSLGPALAMTLFDAGARKAVTAQAQASYDQTVASYRSVVLGALQEVEDQLAALRVLEQESAEQQLAVKAAEKASELATNQYKAGLVSYLNVVTAQTAELSAQRAALGLQGQRLSATIALIKALGGGWQ